MLSSASSIATVGCASYFIMLRFPCKVNTFNFTPCAVTFWLHQLDQVTKPQQHTEFLHLPAHAILLICTWSNM